MKTIQFFTTMILLVSLISSRSYTQCYRDFPKEDLSNLEVQSLKKMREEEMLAQDVYLAFSEMYSLPAFSNISKSETRHTTTIKGLLEKYELKDPAAGHETGIFTDPYFQELYTNLVDQGKASFEKAVKVGLLIEDMDIADLEQAIEKEIDNEDIKTVYGNLLRASRNHMKAFPFHARRIEVEYIPSHISNSKFREITGSELP